jgi:hypothetical protein
MRRPFNEEVAHRSRRGEAYANLSAMSDEKQLNAGLKLNSNQGLMCEEIPSTRQWLNPEGRA